MKYIAAVSTSDPASVGPTISLPMLPQTREQNGHTGQTSKRRGRRGREKKVRRVKLQKSPSPISHQHVRSAEKDQESGRHVQLPPHPETPDGACLTSGLPLRNISGSIHHKKREKEKTEERESHKSLLHLTLLGGKKETKSYFPLSFALFKLTTRGIVSDSFMLWHRFNNRTLLFSSRGMKRMMS